MIFPKLGHICSPIISSHPSGYFFFCSTSCHQAIIDRFFFPRHLLPFSTALSRFGSISGQFFLAGSVAIYRTDRVILRSEIIKCPKKMLDNGQRPQCDQKCPTISQTMLTVTQKWAKKVRKGRENAVAKNVREWVNMCLLAIYNQFVTENRRKCTWIWRPVTQNCPKTAY